ncbi:HTH domain-containing protein [Loigolactobacillus coryniformis]|uniref:hypothetical protein n=1 Tax=Loigolactobacillus coryniformis TaxID=1610 RepID=UPI003F1ED014
MSGLNEQTIKEIATLVAQLVKEERHKQFLHEQTWRLKNTRLLLKNYDILKEHSMEIDTDIDMYLKDVFNQDDLKLRSLTGYKARTKKMMEYTDMMLKSYRTYAEKRDDAARRRYFTLLHMFITTDKWTFMEIADRFDVSEKTIQRDQKKAIEEFSIFLFGIVSLEEMVS